MLSDDNPNNLVTRYTSTTSERLNGEPVEYYKNKTERIDLKEFLIMFAFCYGIASILLTIVFLLFKITGI